MVYGKGRHRIYHEEARVIQRFVRLLEPPASISLAYASRNGLRMECPRKDKLSKTNLKPIVTKRANERPGLMATLN